MIVNARVIPGLSLCVALLTVSTLYYGAIGDVPSTFFGGEGTFLVAPPGGRLVGTATVPAGLIGPLRSLEGVREASPEIYIPTNLDGRSLMARGVDPESFVRIEGGVLRQGRLPATVDEALAGEDLAAAFDLELGESIVLLGSLQRTAARVTVVGIAAFKGPASEELLVPLDIARGLAGIGAADVHLIRVVADDQTQLKTLVESIAPTFTYSDVRLSATTLLPGQRVTMRANLTNWGHIEGTKIVQVRQETTVIAERSYQVAALTTIPVEVDFTLPRSGRYNITINPTFVVNVGGSNLTFARLPETVIAGQAFSFRLLGVDDTPVEGATVTARNVTTTTDEDGIATLAIDTPGRATVQAVRDREQGETGVRELYVVHPAYGAAPSGVITGLVLPASDFGASRGVTLRAELENRGAVAGNVSVPLLVNGSVVATANASLRPGERTLVPLQVTGLAPGDHTLAPGNGTASARIRIVEGEDPRIEALLRGYDERARTQRFSVASGDSADDYVQRTVGNIRAAVLVLSFASGALASLGAIAVLARHMAERRRSLGVLKALGARDRHVAELATWECARHGAIASAIGVGLGIVAAFALDATGLIRAFGHGVHPSLDWTTLALVFLLSTLVLVVAARVLALQALGAPPDALMRDEPPRPAQERA